MGGDLDPLQSCGWPVDSRLGECRTETLRQEPLLVGARGPDLEDDPAALLGAAGVGEHPCGPISLAACHVDAEQLVDLLIGVSAEAFELENQTVCQLSPLW
jgi:hypothetical protein